MAEERPESRPLFGKGFAWFGYRINRSLSTGSKFPFLMLAVGTLLLVLAGAQAIYLGLFSRDSLEAEGIDNRFGGGLFDSYWWSIKHVLDPGAFAEDYGAPIPVLLISFTISIGGLVVLGALIGLISASIQQRLARLELGNTRVVETEHVVLLGWGPSVPGLVRNLLRIHPGSAIVILAPRELQMMREGLRRVGIDPHRRNVVLRSGIPSRRAELERVAVRRASSVVVVAHALDEEQEGAETDVEAIKTLLVLESLLRESLEADEPDQPSRTAIARLPAVVCEISKNENSEIAKIASRGRVSSVSTADFASRLLVQAARQPGIVDVFERILNRDSGGIIVQSEPAAEGVSFADLAHSVENAVPIGVSWVESARGVDRNAAALNPEPSYEVDEGEKLVFLARNDAVLVRNPPQSWPATELEPVEGSASDSSERHFESVLILGWNSLIDEIFSELNGHAIGRTRVTVISNASSDQTERLLADREFPRLDLEIRRGDTVSRSLLADLVDAEYDCIFTLADESDGGDPDARSIMTLLLLGDITARRKRPRTPRVVVELRDGRNRDLLEGSVATAVVVSPDLVSVVMAQISLQPVLGPVYRELLSAGGIEIAMRPATRYARIDEPILHADVISLGQQEFETVLGVRLVGDDGAEVILSPDVGRRWTFGEHDRVIVLSQQIYR